MLRSPSPLMSSAAQASMTPSKTPSASPSNSPPQQQQQQNGPIIESIPVVRGQPIRKRQASGIIAAGPLPAEPTISIDVVSSGAARPAAATPAASAPANQGGDGIIAAGTLPQVGKTITVDV